MSESNTRAEIVEVMARELRAFKEPGYGSTLLTVLAAWVEEEFPSPREAAMAENSAWDTISKIAEAALTALEASGRAVVPRLATDEMILAGEVARHGVPKATVCAVWDNMLAAALPPSKE